MSQAFEEKARASRGRERSAPVFRQGRFVFLTQPGFQNRRPAPEGGSMTRWISRLSLMLPALVLALAITACGGGDGNKSGQPTFTDNPTPIPVATTAAYPLTVQRSDGKALTLTNAPTRVVSLSPGATEIIYAIGAESSLVAVDKQADYPDAAKNFAT
jgi:hypothetical protein